jgi:prephenate dehydratase
MPATNVASDTPFGSRITFSVRTLPSADRLGHDDARAGQVSAPSGNQYPVHVSDRAPAAADPRPSVIFPGEPGSFAEDAVIAAFGEGVTPTPVPTFRDVVLTLTDRGAPAGVLPIENVVFGTVRENYDLLADAALEIVGEVIVPVRLCLAALPGSRIESIERVYSHIQALGQSEAFLRQRPWSLLASTNTAGAGKMIRERDERGSAAVLSPRAAALFGLEVLAADIQSEPRNRTRFLILTPPGGQAPPRVLRTAGTTGSTLLVSVRNEPGTLHRVLGVLAAHGLNMSKLESRPSRSHSWEYVFWMDLDADLGAPEAAPALAALREAAADVRVMGCYPRAAEPF